MLNEEEKNALRSFIKNVSSKTEGREILKNFGWCSGTMVSVNPAHQVRPEVIAGFVNRPHHTPGMEGLEEPYAIILQNTANSSMTGLLFVEKVSETSTKDFLDFTNSTHLDMQKIYDEMEEYSTLERYMLIKDRNDSDIFVRLVLGKMANYPDIVFPSSPSDDCCSS